MASRNFSRRQSLEKALKDLYVRISIGASGAPTLVSGASYGASSITRNSAGDYTLVLQDRYVALKYLDGILIDSTGEDIRLQLKSEAINSSAQSVSFFTLTGATPTDPSNGSELLLKVELKNTSSV